MLVRSRNFNNFLKELQCYKSIVRQMLVQGSCLRHIPCCSYATNVGKSAAMMMNESQRNKTWGNKRQQSVTQGLKFLCFMAWHVRTIL